MAIGAEDVDIPPVRPNEGRVEPSLVPMGEALLVERIRPKRFVEPFHLHPSVEINFLENVRFTHVFSGVDLPLPDRRLILFWGAVPHRARAVAGEGTVMNVYLSLGQLMTMGPERRLAVALLRGDVIASCHQSDDDAAMLARFFAESAKGPDWCRLHLQELAARLRRLALEGWEVLHRAPAKLPSSADSFRGPHHVQAMLEFLSDHYAENISIPDVAAAAGVSANHGTEIFKALTGRTPSTYLKALRIAHAKSMLASTGVDIARIALECGFGSVTRFYEAFKEVEGRPPAEWRRLRQSS
ncbi:MAG: helix-turn-helix domain-containing protein [Pseudomonadota bacterium]